MNPLTEVQQAAQQQNGPETAEQKQQPCDSIDPSKIAYSHLIFNPTKTYEMVVRHCRDVFDAVSFLHKLNEKIRGLVALKTQQMGFLLGGANANNTQKKTLFIDLDETLIKAQMTPHPLLTETFTMGNQTVWYSLRPHAVTFLTGLANSYELILFTTAVAEYALFFFQLFNNKTGGALSYFLHRDHCIHIYRGAFIKPIQLVKDRCLSDVLLLDNSPISFGFNLDNGVPILTWTGNPDDEELPYLAQYLQSLSRVPDSRELNRQTLQLHGMVAVSKSSVIKE